VLWFLSGVLIKRAQAMGGLTLTVTGELSRSNTRAIFDATSWPGYDKAQVLTMHKVLNEADGMPVELTRLTVWKGSGVRMQLVQLCAIRGP
jgi:hypothetical protein